VLEAFATTVRWAGPLGSGHATKALNNALSAVSLMGSAELLVTAVACGYEEPAAVEAFNAGPARSQNSEVKLPRDVLTRTYAAGFTAALMVKDLSIALRIAADRSTSVPFLSGAAAAWREAAEAMGPDADFTRVHAVLEQRRGGSAAGPPGALDVLTRALAALNLLAAREVLRVADAEGLDRERALGIVNTSTGRSEATRSAAAGEVDVAALRAAHELARRTRTWTPLTALGAQ
jgi:3-hydroxyisobutyrate dehydrogenase-like beta-hydroxyacid dehydrogenase